MADDRRQEPDDRRGLDRRVETLERQYIHIQAALQKVEMMQDRAREVLDSRYEATSKGQDLVTAELKHLSDKIAQISEKVASSDGVRDQLVALNKTVHDLVSLKDRLLGGLTLITLIGFGILVTGVTIVIKAFANSGHP